MTRSYEVLFHNIFTQQARTITTKDKEIERFLVTALEEIRVNPIPGGLQGISNPRLEGKIHKKHVKGPGGHRLIYLFLEKQGIVIPVFLSPELKSNFSYDEIEWGGIAETFQRDYLNKNYAAFTNWRK